MQVRPADQAGYPEILQRASLDRALQVSSVPLLENFTCKSHEEQQLHEVGSDPLRSWPRTVHTHTPT